MELGNRRSEVSYWDMCSETIESIVQEKALCEEVSRVGEGYRTPLPNGKRDIFGNRIYYEDIVREYIHLLYIRTMEMC